MKLRSLGIIAAALLIVGGGCGRINERYGEKENKVVVVPLAIPTKETINLADAELFLRSRDDVAPGQADVTNQTLFAKTKDGHIVEIVKDVHEALGGKLGESYFLVLEKNIPAGKYVYFYAQELNEKVSTTSPSVARRLYAFDNDTKKFVDLPVTELNASQILVRSQYSPDYTKLAVIRREGEQTEVVYIADFASGNVTHKYEVAKVHTFMDPNTSGAEAFVHPETKWIDADKFQIVLFKQKQKAKNGKFVPVDVAVINTIEKLSEENRLEGVYTYDQRNDVLYISKEDGFYSVVIVGVQKQLFGIIDDNGLNESLVYMDEDVGAKKAHLVFRADVSGEEIDPPVAVFDKHTGVFLEQGAWPSNINKK